VLSWDADRVANWVLQIGFSKGVAEAFKEVGVDGDLLLLLDERNLKEDVRMGNGIHRKRFLRELKHLKRMADYTDVDENDIAGFLDRKLGGDYRAFAYNLIKHDLSPDYMRHLNEVDLEDMLKEAGLASTIHRRKIAEAVYDLGEDECDFAPAYGNSSDRLSPACVAVDVFVSYDRVRSAELASLIKMQLQFRGLSVYTADVRDAHAVKCIREAKSFVVVLAPGALDGCVGGGDQRRDPLRRNVVAALEAGCNVVPVIDNFQFPDPDELPTDVRGLCYFNAVRWVHDYQDACVGKLERFVRGGGDVGRSVESPRILTTSHSTSALSAMVATTTSSSSAVLSTRRRHDSDRSTSTVSLSVYSPVFGRRETKRTVSVESMHR